MFALITRYSDLTEPYVWCWGSKAICAESFFYATHQGHHKYATIVEFPWFEIKDSVEDDEFVTDTLRKMRLL